MTKENILKIINNYFSDDNLVSEYSKPYLRLPERKLFKKYLFKIFICFLLAAQQKN